MGAVDYMINKDMKTEIEYYEDGTKLIICYYTIKLFGISIYKYKQFVGIETNG
jgi:peroxiredoxin family protein